MVGEGVFIVTYENMYFDFQRFQTLYHTYIGVIRERVL